MAISTFERNASIAEMAVEMDRRGEVIDRLETRVATIEAALRSADDAIAELYRYWTGGEMRGSYDGRPERENLWKAHRAVKAALRQQESRT